MKKSKKVIWITIGILIIILLIIVECFYMSKANVWNIKLEAKDTDCISGWQVLRHGIKVVWRLLKGEEGK